MASEKAPFKRGDWVRFYCSGDLVIGQVEYVMRDGWGGYWRAQTDIGSVREDAIQEIRAATPTPEASDAT